MESTFTPNPPQRKQLPSFCDKQTEASPDSLETDKQRKKSPQKRKHEIMKDPAFLSLPHSDTIDLSFLIQNLKLQHQVI